MPARVLTLPPRGTCCWGSSPPSRDSTLVRKCSRLYASGPCLTEDALIVQQQAALCVNDLWFLSSSPCDSDAPDLITWPLSLLSSCKFTRVTDFCVNSIVEGGLIFEGGVKWRFHCAYLHVELGAALSKHGCCTYMAGAPCFDRHREHYAFFTFLYHTSLRSAFVLIDQSAYFK